MSRALDVETEVALRIRRAVRSGRLVGAIWCELYRVDRDAFMKVRLASAEGCDAPPAVVGDRTGSSHGTGASVQAWPQAATGLVHRLRDQIATWAKRRRDRLELLDYLAQDHRAAADIGTTRAAADHWAQQPFWRL